MSVPRDVWHEAAEEMQTQQDLCCSSKDGQVIPVPENSISLKS